MTRFYLILAMLFAATSVIGANTAFAQGNFAPAPEGAASTTEVHVSAPQTQATSDLDLNTATRRAAHYDSPKIYTGERISLDFQNADIHNIIRIIGEISGKNVVVSDAVSGKVTLKLKDVPWDQALDIVLSAQNLGVEESGNVLTIYGIQTLNELRRTRASAEAERAAARELAPLTKKVFTPKYAPISMVATELTKIKSPRGKIVAIGNDIYVEEDPGTMASMTQIFMRIDKVARQILIEARIIEATSAFIENIGVKWNIGYNRGTGSPSYQPDNTADRFDTVGGLVDINKGATLGFGFINRANSLMLNAELKASEVSSDSRTISAPRIMAANDQEVSIKQGKQIGYSTGSTATTTAGVQFKDVIMELKVKPHIEENGRIVTLDIKLTNDTPASAGAGEDLAINKREAETKLMVKDGETVVIGGIVVDNQSTGINRVPGVHRVPILGWLFQERGINNDKSEMLIFITANIIPINI